jgi:hypothetical protein
MERLFEVKEIKIDNKSYFFDIPDVTIKNYYKLSSSQIENRIKEEFYNGYNDNKNKSGKKNNFDTKFVNIMDARIFRKTLKKAYMLGYNQFDKDEKSKYEIDLDVNDPILNSKLKLLIKDQYEIGLSDGRKNIKKNKNIEIPDDLLFLQNKIRDVLIKAYDDGFKEGLDFFKDKYYFELPILNDEDLENEIRTLILNAYHQGKEDFKNKKQRKFEIKKELIFFNNIVKNQVENLIQKAYNDGYDDYLKKADESVKKKKEENSIRQKESDEIKKLIKKFGTFKENGFLSGLYQYIIQNQELKISDEYNFINIKTDNNLLNNKVSDIVKSAYFKGKEDAINGKNKGIYLFRMPISAKEDLIKSQISNLVSKAYDDGYKKIKNEINNEISNDANLNPDEKRLRELLKKYKKPIKMISNKDDRYINKEIYTVEIENGFTENN